MSTTIHFPYKSVTLNSEQYKVVTADPYENQRILASAGSGKTTTITSRISWLIHTHSVKPEQIVLLTFSRNAAREMTNRVRALIGPVQLWSGTFHGLARQVLASEESSASQGNYFVDELPVRWIQWMRTPQGRKWVGRLRYVIVDEFQDINAIQWRLLESLRHPGVRITIVGDDAQNIYTWRGSSAGFLLDIQTYIRNITDYQLKLNYRSTEAIVAVANSIMRGIPTLDWKEHMVAVQKGGWRPDVLFFWRLCDECLWIAKTIQEIRATTPDATIAILARNNIDLYRIEEVLLEKGLKPKILAMDSVEATEQAKPTEVALATFHGSKGLEWDAVFCISLSDDQLPSRKRSEDIIGERRLFYVACTRARRRLFLTYHGNERKLSRFVREIGYKLLQFHGLARYALSDVEIGGTGVSLQSILDSLDGDDWLNMRKQGILPWSAEDKLPVSTHNLFTSGESWRSPSWAEGREFEAFVRLFCKRCILALTGWQTEFTDPCSERMIFTLRIFQEDKAFWEKWREEIDMAIRYFFKDSAKMPPASYVDVYNWSQRRGLGWSQTDCVSATAILAKLRGQLRPLRFDSYTLDELTVGPAHVVSPTEYRADILRSWRVCSNKEVNWRDCLVDIWRISCLEQVAEGRNAGLFRVSSIQHLLPECIPFLERLEGCLAQWIDSSEIKGPTLNPEIASDGMAPIRADCFIGNRLVRFSGERRPDLYMWVESCLMAYLFMKEGSETLQTIQIFHPFQGSMLSLRIPEAPVLEGLYNRLVSIWSKKSEQ